MRDIYYVVLLLPKQPGRTNWLLAFQRDFPGRGKKIAYNN
jgi:hypothetical protein